MAVIIAEFDAKVVKIHRLVSFLFSLFSLRSRLIETIKPQIDKHEASAHKTINSPVPPKLATRATTTVVNKREENTTAAMKITMNIQKPVWSLGASNAEIIKSVGMIGRNF